MSLPEDPYSQYHDFAFQYLIPLSPYFDQSYYLRQNPDVMAAVQSGIFWSAWDHFSKYGMAEGRTGSLLFDPNVYRTNNPDLAEAGITSNVDLIKHFYTYGQSENRIFIRESVFDWEYYLEKNPDLVAAGITARIDAEKHFKQHGINEGRIPHPDIEGASYVDQHPICWL